MSSEDVSLFDLMSPDLTKQCEVLLEVQDSIRAWLWTIIIIREKWRSVQKAVVKIPENFWPSILRHENIGPLKNWSNKSSMKVLQRCVDKPADILRIICNHKRNQIQYAQAKLL